MFFTRKDRAVYDASIAQVSKYVTDTGAAIDDRITAEVSKLEDRIDAIVAQLKKETDATEYAEPKRVTENDEAAAQKDSA